jgi:excisionase family DNA binding protein
MAKLIYDCQLAPKLAILEGPMQEILLTAHQVARYLRIDKFTVYRLVSQKKLPAFKVGNQWRFKRQLLDEWLKKNSNVNLDSTSKDECDD